LKEFNPPNRRVSSFMGRLITITTDFGDSFAAAQLTAVISSLGYEGRIAENHSVKPYSVTEGAFEILVLSRFSPEGTVNLGVVDPGVGSDRWGIIIQTKKSWLVGPNNGLLLPAANEQKIEKVWKINENYFGKVSNTFHGRDVFIKAAVLLAKGKRPEEFGCAVIKSSGLESLEFKEGQVVHIDAYGNAKIWGKQTFGLPIVKTFSDVKEGQPLILNGSSDTLEIAINQGSAEQYFGLKLGQIVKSFIHK